MSTTTTHAPMADKGLKGGSLGLVAVIVIGVASTAPGYSLAASLGFVTGEAGFQAPFIIMFAFVPMACIAAAFYYLNKADPDCGTNFTWGVRSLGPKIGWLSGWGCIIADLIIMPNLAGISGQYLVLLFSEDLADNIWLTTSIGVLFIVAMTWVCWKGIELSARTQVVLLGTELLVLGGFAVMALWKAYGGASETVDGVTYTSVEPSWSWLSPSGLSSSAIIAGLVVAIFIYWGWDTCVSVNEEAKDSARTPGLAAVLSTVILLGIYLLVTVGAVSLLGPAFVTDNQDSEALYQLGVVAMPDAMVKLLIIAILTSAAASCQTTILPATRTMLSMGSHRAAPEKLAQISPRQLTPDFSTWLFGIVSIGWYLLLVVISSNTSTDAYNASIAAVGMAIALYYGISGVSCIVYYRGWLLRSVKNFVMVGLLPAFGAIVLIYVFAKTVWDARGADYGYGTIFGLGTVMVIGTALLLLGVPLVFICSRKYPTFFTFRPDAQVAVKDPSGDDVLAAPLGTYRKAGV
jgi:amino acid transporter